MSCRIRRSDKLAQSASDFIGIVSMFILVFQLKTVKEEIEIRVTTYKPSDGNPPRVKGLAEDP
jgi:hypothetical protein